MKEFKERVNIISIKWDTYLLFPFIFLLCLPFLALPFFGAYQVKTNLISRVQMVNCHLASCSQKSQGYYCSFLYPDLNNNLHLALGTIQVIRFGSSWFSHSDSIEYLDLNHNMVSAQVIEARYNGTKTCFADPHRQSDLYLDMGAQIKSKNTYRLISIIATCIGLIGSFGVICLSYFLIFIVAAFKFPRLKKEEVSISNLKEEDGNIARENNV